ncbi:small ribosomal subunit protein uS11m-like [Cylas formicarius]|uniref:small ribosomal subunit protein uS11m-like n=1 Tax=Cylas formicarius TaxID=197179 RepID=UPI002958CCBB|nr:small ribosomal subunit protein uS11m-like [Cylas formicarius]
MYHLPRITQRCFSTSCLHHRQVEDRKLMLKSAPALDQGTTGEHSLTPDTISDQKLYPGPDSQSEFFNGIRYSDLPICNIKATKNNTIISFTNAKYVPLLIRSCGVEGFKNAKKGTSVATQATAISIGKAILERGFRTVRVRIGGLGPGRIAAAKGLEMVGLKIVSVTDNTKVSWNPPRPRKARKL